jgi:hypothetical protein
MPEGRATGIVAGIVVAAGLILAGVGVAGALGKWGTTESISTSATASPSSTAGTTTKAAPTNETPQQFLDALATAVRDGDVTFQLDRLHPAVIDRYGSEQCRADITTRTDPSRRYVVKSVSPAARPYDYASDGQSVTIEGAITIEADVVDHGQTQPVTVHLAKTDGTYAYFSDCGTPL